jgi:membrane fusion protein (multidrug efflux system)
LFREALIDVYRKERGAMARRLIIMAALLTLVFGGLFGWKAFVRLKTAEYLANARAPAVVVSSAEVQEDRWQQQVESVGTLSAIQGVDVSSEVPGTVADISFRSGQQIRKGELLVQLDATAEHAELRSLEAQLVLARLDYERAQGLRESTALSQAQLDRAKSVMDSLQAQVEEQAAFIAKKSIRAPFAGELGIREINLGEYVSPGTTIVTLQTLDPIYANFTLPERFLRELAVGQQLRVAVAAYPEDEFSGSVTAISPKVQETTRNVMIQATIANADRRLRPGMFARITVLTGGDHRVLTVPRTAITFNPYGESVFVITKKDGALVVDRRQVITGEIRNERVEVVSGLLSGDLVVGTGQLKLRAGQRVEIDNSIDLSRPVTGP